jgi:hypothetical protein
VFKKEIKQMPVQEIPPAEWSSFCDSFSRQHRGGLVSIMVTEPGKPPQIKAHELPLQGITAEWKEGNASISVTVGNEPSEPRTHLTHIVTNPIQLRFWQTDTGAHEGIEIESGAETIGVRFRVAVLPEEVDGILI